MSTDTQIAVAADTVADVDQDLQLIARSPVEMKLAQARLAEWCRAKIAICENDAAELAENFEIAAKNGWKTSTLERHAKLADKRADFYRKIAAAVEEGYCIVPNFPVDIFAIRTTRKKPDEQRGFQAWDEKKQHSNSPQLGEGDWKDSSPQIYERHNVPTGDKDSTGKDISRTQFFARYFADEIEFPISVAKPQIMSATAEAMALKCFDELGVLPGRKPKGDPIVVGRIYDPRNGYRDKFVTFLIAWYVDTRAL